MISMQDHLAFQEWGIARWTPSSRTIPTTWSFQREWTSAHSADWAAQLSRRLEELMSLRRGWDGYDGRAVSRRHASFALSLLVSLYRPDVPAPSLVPGGDGSLQIEWHRNQITVEIDILAPNEVVATRIDRRTNEIEEIGLDVDLSRVARWIAELAGDVAGIPAEAA